jgi:hypothetical protein
MAAEQVSAEMVRSGRPCSMCQVLRLWRLKIQKWHRTDSRIVGHCRSVRAKLLKRVLIPPSLPTNIGQCDLPLKIASLNVGGGLHNLTSTLAHFGRAIDLFCFQEVWQLPTEDLSKELPPGYSVVSKARACDAEHRGGGVAVIFKSSIPVKELRFASDVNPPNDEGEFMCLKVGQGANSVVLWNLYLQPASKDIPDTLLRRMIESHRHSQVIVLGDFNWNALAHGNTSTREKCWRNFFNQFGFTFVNANCGPTFERRNCTSLVFLGLGFRV